MSENNKPKKAAGLVVGVDGSPGAAEALRWAVAEARLRKARLRIVHAWIYGYVGMPSGGIGYMGSFGSNAALGIEPEDLQQAAEDVLEKAIADVVGGVEGVEVERKVVEGAAAQVLIGAAVGADLLVVGSRGHGDFVGLLLGSVSQQCVHYAPCPVVVVHSPKATATDKELAHSAATKSAAAV